MNELERFFRHLVGHLSAEDRDNLTRAHQLDILVNQLFPYRIARRRLAIECSEDYEVLMMRLAAGEGGYLELADPKAVDTLRQELSTVNPDLSLLAVFGDIQVRFSLPAVSRVLGQPDDAPYRPDDDQVSEEDLIDDIVEELGLSAVEQTAEPEDHHAEEVVAEAPVSSATDHEPEADWPGESAPPEAGSYHTAEEVSQDGPPPPPPLPFAAPEVPSRAEPKPAGGSCGACGTATPAGPRIRFCPNCGRNLKELICGKCQARLEAGWRHCVECGAPVSSS